MGHASQRPARPATVAELFRRALAEEQRREKLLAQLDGMKERRSWRTRGKPSAN